MMCARKVVILAILGMIATGCSGGGTTGLRTAVDACDMPSRSFDRSKISLGDDDQTLVVDAVKAGGLDGVICVLAEMDTPESIVAAIDSTTAMMGRQHDEAGNYEYEWSYHPDNGLNLIVTEAD